MARSAFLADADDGATLYSYALGLLQAAVSDGTLTAAVVAADSNPTCRRRLSAAGRDGRALSMASASVDSVSVSTHSPSFAPTPEPTTPAPTPTCVDINNGAADLYGDNCDDYASRLGWCGNYNDNDFTSDEMCCACGGGVDAPSPSPPPAAPPSPSLPPPRSAS